MDLQEHEAKEHQALSIHTRILIEAIVTALVTVMALYFREPSQTFPWFRMFLLSMCLSILASEFLYHIFRYVSFSVGSME